MDPVAPIIEETLTKLGFLKEVKSRLSLFYWDEIAGKNIASRTQPVFIKKGILFVKVANSTWAYHLTLIKPTLISRINQKIGSKVVKDIHFQVGTLERTIPEEKDLHRKTPSSITVPEGLLAPVEVAPPEYKALLISIIKKAYYWRFDKIKKGWKKCSCCDILIPPDSRLCPSCHYRIKKVEKRVNKQLEQTPWVTYQQVKKNFPFLEKKYWEYCRGRFIKRTRKEIYSWLTAKSNGRDDAKLKDRFMQYVMVKTGLPPENINEGHICNYLKDFPHVLHNIFFKKGEE